MNVTFENLLRYANRGLLLPAEVGEFLRIVSDPHPSLRVSGLSRLGSHRHELQWAMKVRRAYERSLALGPTGTVTCGRTERVSDLNGKPWMQS